jgi:hypothetical protein
MNTLNLKAHRRTGTLIHSMLECEMAQPLWEAVSYKTKLLLLNDPATAHLGICSSELKT